MGNIITVVMAAGEGTRMKTNTSKVLSVVAPSMIGTQEVSPDIMVLPMKLCYSSF